MARVASYVLTTQLTTRLLESEKFKMLTGSNYKALLPTPPRRDQLFFDGTVKALALRTYTSGKGTWVLQYRPKSVAGDRSKIGTKKAVLGDRQTMSLSEARQAARSLLAKIDQGNDPVADKKSLRDQLRLTVQSQIDTYSADLERRQVINRKTAVSALRRGLHGVLSAEVSSLTLSQLLQIIEGIEKRGKIGAAQDFRKFASAFLSFCLSRGSISTNPLSGFRRPRRTRAEMLHSQEYGRILSDVELVKIWKAAERRTDSFGFIVRFLILSGTRRSEGANLKREFLTDYWINYPATFTKQARGHSIPISSEIRRLIQQSPNRGDLIWPSHRSTKGNTAISGWTKYVSTLRASSGIADFNLHDLRRTFRTWCEEKYGASDALCEAAIGHVSKNVLNRIYSRPKWEGDLMDLFEAWGNHVAQIAKSRS